MKPEQRKQKINIYKTIASVFDNNSTKYQERNQYSFQSVRNISQITLLSKNNKNYSSYSELNLFSNKKQSQQEKQKQTNFNNSSNTKSISTNIRIQVIDEIGQTDWQLVKHKSKIIQITQTQQKINTIPFNGQGSIIKNYDFAIRQDIILQVFECKQIDNELEAIQAIKKENQSNIPLISYDLLPYSDLLSFLPIYSISKVTTKTQNKAVTKNQINKDLYFADDQKLNPNMKELILILTQLDKNKQALECQMTNSKGQMNISTQLIKQNLLNSLIKYYYHLMQNQNNHNIDEIDVQTNRSLAKKQKQLSGKIKDILIICKYIRKYSSQIHQNNQQKKKISNFIRKQLQLNNQHCSQKTIQIILQKFNSKIQSLSWLQLIKILFQIFSLYKCFSNNWQNINTIKNQVNANQIH